MDMGKRTLFVFSYKNKSIIVGESYAIVHYLQEIHKFLCLENNLTILALAVVKMYCWFF